MSKKNLLKRAIKRKSPSSTEAAEPSAPESAASDSTAADSRRSSLSRARRKGLSAKPAGGTVRRTLSRRTGTNQTSESAEESTSSPAARTARTSLRSNRSLQSRTRLKSTEESTEKTSRVVRRRSQEQQEELEEATTSDGVQSPTETVAEANTESTSTEELNPASTKSDSGGSPTPTVTEPTNEKDLDVKSSSQEASNTEIDSTSQPSGVRERNQELRSQSPAYSRLGSAVVAPPPGYGEQRKSATKQAETENRWQNRPSRPDSSSYDKDSRDGKDSRKPRTTRGRQRRNRDWSQERDMDSPNLSHRRRRSRKKEKKASPQAKAIKRRIEIDQSIMISDFAHQLSIKSTEIIRKLVELGQLVTVNDSIDFETAQMIAEDYHYEVVDASFKEEEFLIQEQDVSDVNALPRPSVVTIMGHVDHGKTTLLDSIRSANVADGEAGGITQHTSAYQVEHEGSVITFIDTPGHEAFTEMRARGAMVTDIVVLVIAADDGAMPQTIEALNHARAAEVQLIVAVNKCDKPGANPAKARQDLMNHGLVPEDYGGDTMFVDISALNGDGIPELLEGIVLLSEMGEYTAPVDRHADGYVLEARLDRGRGPVATLLVKNGTLKRGDSLVLGNVWGRVRAMNDYRGQRINEATPSMPVELIGLQDIPVAGDDFVVVKSDKDARTLVEHRLELAREAAQSSKKKVTLEDLVNMQNADEIVKLNLILKSDVGGTLEAMKASLDKVSVPGTELNILHSGIGAINEGDISLANTYDGIVIGFNVRPDSNARRQVTQTGVEVRTYSIIYEALDDINKALLGLLAPEFKEVSHGLAEIRETFSVPRVGTVAGCYVLDGKIARGHKIRLLREGTILWEGRLASLRRFKDDVREVEKSYECGMNLDGFNDIKVGDQIESYTMEEVERV